MLSPFSDLPYSNPHPLSVIPVVIVDWSVVRLSWSTLLALDPVRCRTVVIVKLLNNCDTLVGLELSVCYRRRSSSAWSRSSSAGDVTAADVGLAT